MKNYFQMKRFYRKADILVICISSGRSIRDEIALWVLLLMILRKTWCLGSAKSYQIAALYLVPSEKLMVFLLKTLSPENEGVSFGNLLIDELIRIVP